MSSGPFNMMPGDTQEVVFAQIAAGAQDGIDNLGAVALLKFYAKQVKQLYRGSCPFPYIGNPPEVMSFASDRQIILHWGSSVEQVERANSDYKFQGYNVYQLPDENAEKNDWRKIKTYDVADGIKIIYEEVFDRRTNYLSTVVTQTGSDSGIERFINIERDYPTEEMLNNGTNYFYVVESYYYNNEELAFPKTLTLRSEVIKVMPQSAMPGVVASCEFGESLYVTHLSGSGDSDVDVMVIDPLQLTGHEYEITFHESAGQLTWNLEDITSGETKLTSQTNITGTDEYYIVDGFRIIITQDTSNQLSSNDVFKFTTPAVSEDVELAKHDVDKINVFPNPYYGGHANELNQYHNYVIFNHLPERAKFRIFNLAGHLVRTLEKDDDTQFYVWDLQNEHRMLAPSGLYIIYIEMPDLQKVKVLKLAIVQREVVPGNF